jgi:RecA-family ATPase
MRHAIPIDYDYEPPGEPFLPSKPARLAINAKPFVWIEPAAIPPRKWIYGGHYIRKFVSTTVAPGGVGKSSLEIAEILAMTSGRPILGHNPSGRFKVWMWNGEDPEEELQRRIMAAAVQHGLAAKDFEGRLFVDSGRDMELVIAEQTRDGAQIIAPVIDAIKATITANKIDVVIIDPFVSSHRVT